MELTALEKIKTGFPPEIPFPAILEKLIIWDETENPELTPMGYFEFNEYGRNAWMHPVNEAGLKHLAQFGLSPDGGQFCLWAKEDGTMPVVYLGTGQGAKAIAKNLEGFIILLAIGYPNIESADMSLSPMACYEKYDKPTMTMTITMMTKYPLLPTLILTHRCTFNPTMLLILLRIILSIQQIGRASCRERV